jgi:hypothetical protein
MSPAEAVAVARTASGPALRRGAFTFDAFVFWPNILQLFAKHSRLKLKHTILKMLLLCCEGGAGAGSTKQGPVGT